MKLLFLVIFFSLSIQSANALSPTAKGYLSIIPGAGQIADGRVLEGLLWAGATVGAFKMGAFHEASPIDVDPPNLGLSLLFYQMYEAYQVSGGSPAASNAWYENLLGTINPLNLLDPIGAAHLIGGTAPVWTQKDFSGVRLGRVASYMIVGWGEEALFRGFLFPSWSDAFGSHWLGAISSSLVFSAAHLEFGTIFIMRAVSALIWCLQTYIHDYDFRKSAFVHTWFDILYTDENIGLSQNVGFKAGLKFYF